MAQARHFEEVFDTTAEDVRLLVSNVSSGKLKELSSSNAIEADLKSLVDQIVKAYPDTASDGKRVTKALMKLVTELESFIGNPSPNELALGKAHQEFYACVMDLVDILIDIYEASQASEGSGSSNGGSVLFVGAEDQSVWFDDHGEGVASYTAENEGAEVKIDVVAIGPNSSNASIASVAMKSTAGGSPLREASFRTPMAEKERLLGAVLAQGALYFSLLEKLVADPMTGTRAETRAEVQRVITSATAQLSQLQASLEWDVRQLGPSHEAVEAVKALRTDLRELEGVAVSMELQSAKAAQGDGVDIMQYLKSTQFVVSALNIAMEAGMHALNTVKSLPDTRPSPTKTKTKLSTLEHLGMLDTDFSGAGSGVPSPSDDGTPQESLFDIMNGWSSESSPKSVLSKSPAGSSVVDLSPERCGLKGFPPADPVIMEPAAGVPTDRPGATRQDILDALDDWSED